MSTLLRFAVTAVALSALGVNAQTFQRLGTCPTLGCVFPPDQADFLPGQNFDIRVEVHAPVNGSEAFNNGVPDEKFTLVIQREKGRSEPVTSFFDRKEPVLEKWTFNYFEDLIAKKAGKPTAVNVASKIYRQVALYTPGVYTATLKYYGKQTTIAHWTVREPVTDPKRHKAKNVLFFIGESIQTIELSVLRFPSR